MAEQNDDIQASRALRDQTASRHGEWTAHDIGLAEGVSTRLGRGDHHRLRRCLQLAADLTGRPLDALRVLDLGALEGQYAIEFALHGAEAVAIEGRNANIEKARLARDFLGLDKVELREEDVRSLSRERHGTFDVVLCLGLLYHLDAEHVFPFLSQLAEVCRGILIIDTHIALRGTTRQIHDGHEYRGLRFVEHDPRASREQRGRSLWASLDNAESFWPTRPSLLRGLMRAGFTSVMTAEVPVIKASRDRITLVAIKGERVTLRSPPSDPEDDLPPEQNPPRFVRNQSRGFLLAKRVALRGLVIRERFTRRSQPASAGPT